MSYSSEHPDAPEIEVGELEERADAAAERKFLGQDSLVDSDGAPVDASEAMLQREAAEVLGMAPTSLGRYRRDGIVNPEYLLTSTSPIIPPGAGKARPVWYRRSLVNLIAAGDPAAPPLFIEKPQP
jgi:hypothetical protein